MGGLHGLLQHQPRRLPRPDEPAHLQGGRSGRAVSGDFAYIAAGSRFGQFQGYGAYAFTTDALGAMPVAVVERPGATAYYQWQVSIVPERKTAVVVFALNDGAQLGYLFQKSGPAVELLRVALDIQ